MRRLVLLSAALILSILASAQQLFNSGFESWIINGINHTPAGWTSSNDFSVPIGARGVIADSTAYEGLLCARIETTLIGFAAQPYAGFIVNGKMNVSGIHDADSIYKAGEPFTGRPDALLGYYKYSSESMIEDWGHVFVILKKFNPVKGTIDTVGYGSNTLLNPSEKYREFRVPIDYLMEDVEPDSIVVAFFSTYPNSPLAGGKLWIDELSMEYVTGTGEAADAEKNLIYPNPVVSDLWIDGPVPAGVKVFNCIGEVLLTEVNQNHIDTRNLPVGVYFLRIDSGRGVQVLRFLKVK